MGVAGLGFPLALKATSTTAVAATRLRHLWSIYPVCNLACSGGGELAEGESDHHLHFADLLPDSAEFSGDFLAEALQTLGDRVDF